MEAGFRFNEEGNFCRTGGKLVADRLEDWPTGEDEWE
jgi:hypothetical protein